MNPNTPYNSGTLKNMVQKVRVYCAKVIPLVFDNTLSYYESLCACVAKVNELCDAVDAQNLTIVEFTHLVEVELDKLSKYIDDQVTALDTRVTANEENIHTLTVKTDNQELVLQNLEQWREWASGQLSDIRDILATCLKQTDITDTITDGDTTHVPTANAVYDAIQNATGVTVRDAQANPTHGIVKGIVTTDFQQLTNPLSITNGVMSMREATKNVTGYVQVGDNINVTNGVISVPEGSTTAIGVVGLKQTGAIEKTLDGIDVKTGDYIYKRQNGALDVPLATNSQLGIVAPKLGGALDIQSSGEIDAKNATTAQKGVVTLTDTVTSGDITHVPTADAVYNAVQGGGGGTIPDATTTTKGKVQIGDNINVSSGVISVPTAAVGTKGVMTLNQYQDELYLSGNGELGINAATANSKGVVQVGTGIDVTNGVISVPEATASVFGLVSKTTNIASGSTAVPTSGAVYDAIQAASTTVPDATSDTKGKVKPGVGLEIAAATPGIITLATATQNTLGGFKVTDTITDGDTTHVPTADAVYDAVQSASGTVPDATTTTKGKVQIGDNINVSSGVISVPDASALTKGVMSVGSGLVANQGLVYLAGASDNAIGGVKIGDGLKNDANDKLTIDSDTTLAINQSGKLTVRTATPDNVGLTTIDGTNSNLTMAYGKIDVPTGSTSTKGVLQVGSNLNVSSGVISAPAATNSQLGVVAPRLGGALNIQSSGEIDAKDATTSQKGVVTLASTLGSQLTTVVPTADVVYNECAPRALENIALRSDTPDADGRAQLYKIDALGTRSNVSPKVIDASKYDKGVVQVGDNLTVFNGLIDVPTAGNYTAGVVTLTSSISNGDTTHVPTADAVYDAINSATPNTLKPIEFGTSFTSDAFVTIGNEFENPTLISAGSLLGNTIALFQSADEENFIVIWLKKTIFGINTRNAALELVTSIPTYTNVGTSTTGFLYYNKTINAEPLYNNDYIAISYYTKSIGGTSTLELQCFYR